MALNTITQIKLLNGKVIDMVDWTDKPIFSTIDLLTGFTSQDMSLFQYVVGDNVPGVGPGAVTMRTSTERETNLQAPGAMSSSEEMLIYAIKPEINNYYLRTPNNFQSMDYVIDDSIAIGTGFPAPTFDTLAVLGSQLLLSLEISQKEYARAALAYFNTGFGVSPTRTGNALSAMQSAANLGIASQEAVRSFVVPHHIGAQEKFRVKLLNPSSIGNGAVNFGLVAVYGEGTSNELRSNIAATVRINLDGLYKRPVS